MSLLGLFPAYVIGHDDIDATATYAMDLVPIPVHTVGTQKAEEREEAVAYYRERGRERREVREEKERRRENQELY